ncbi:MAG TPA: GNAT family N-acetyltransferase [Candidatus Micrarchaeaceae archaeon]|nr:GNAT family N-acetyltransferase [Candidatus Micrarchaeaceae archaeon]
MEPPAERLLLRRWRDADRGPFAALNADPIATEHFPSVLTRAESDARLDRIEAFFEANGYRPWAVGRKDRHESIGFVGLTLLTFDAHFTPATEVGWRLAREHWGHRFATKAARSVLR